MMKQAFRTEGPADAEADGARAKRSQTAAEKEQKDLDARLRKLQREEGEVSKKMKQLEKKVRSVNRRVRTDPLGQDRAWSRYYCFRKAVQTVFVQTPGGDWSSFPRETVQAQVTAALDTKGQRELGLKAALDGLNGNDPAEQKPRRGAQMPFDFYDELVSKSENLLDALKRQLVEFEAKLESSMFRDHDKWKRQRSAWVDSLSEAVSGAGLEAPLIRLEQQLALHAKVLQWQQASWRARVQRSSRLESLALCFFQLEDGIR